MAEDVLDALGRWQDAIDELAAIVALDPARKTFADFELAFFRMNLGQWSAAVDGLLEVADELGDEAWTDLGLLCNLAEALWMTGAAGDAGRILEIACEAADLENKAHLIRLADAHAALQRHAEAVDLVGRLAAMIAGTLGDGRTALEHALDESGSLRLNDSVKDSIRVMQTVRDTLDEDLGPGPHPLGDVAERERVMAELEPFRARAMAAREGTGDDR
jgi:hypothetical protein